MDIFLAVVLFLVTLATAYLGVHATLHPAETERAKTRYKVGFGALTLVAAGLIAWQAVLNRIEQSGLHSQLNKIQKNTETPPTVSVSVAPPAKAYVDFDRIEMSWDQQKSILTANVYGTNKVLEIARDVDGRNTVSVVPAVKGIPSRETQEKYFADLDKQPTASWGRVYATLGPGQSLFGTIELHGFTQQIVDQINSGDKVLLTVGTILFSDDRGRHRKNFCEWVQGPFSTSNSKMVTHFCEAGHNDLMY